MPSKNKTNKTKADSKKHTATKVEKKILEEVLETPVVETVNEEVKTLENKDEVKEVTEVAEPTTAEDNEKVVDMTEKTVDDIVSMVEETEEPVTFVVDNVVFTEKEVNDIVEKNASEIIKQKQAEEKSQEETKPRRRKTYGEAYGYNIGGWNFDD